MSQTMQGTSFMAPRILQNSFMSLCLFPAAPKGWACGLSGQRTTTYSCLSTLEDWVGVWG